MDDIIYERENNQAGPATIICPKIQRLRELFRGRFAYEEAERLINHHNGDLLATVNFALTADLPTIRNISRSDDEGWQIVRNNRAWRELALQGQLTHEERQYACGHVIMFGGERYQPGRGYQNVNGAMFDTTPYLVTGNGDGQNLPAITSIVGMCLEDLVRWKTHGVPVSAVVHHAYPHNCFRRATGPQLGGICVHPRSLRRGERAVFPSHSHNSTGSTVDTFLTQDDLVSRMSDFEPDVSDIDEDNDSQDGGL
ncbi:unnamed protein product [Mytilus coruscus]|uniref:Uncharacterized protein n=1 Tax=Mytilus coruscus TaxID=42192 RepID=A0A6J8E7N4_MYTCO|nr:unnamed protein product [Mytilus coruscus]